MSATLATPGATPGAPRTAARTATREARSRALAAAVVAAAAVAGAALGVAADRFAVARRPAAAPSGLDAFAAELELTPVQRRAVDSIMTTRRRAVDEIVAPVRPQLDAIRDASRRDIRHRLTPAQQARYDAYLARMERQERDTRR